MALMLLPHFLLSLFLKPQMFSPISPSSGVSNLSGPVGQMSAVGLVHRLGKWHRASPAGWVRPTDLPYARSSAFNACSGQSGTRLEEIQHPECFAAA